MTSKLILFYSLKGNTKGLIDSIDTNNYDVININKLNIDFSSYETILIGTSTYGEGVPPLPFYNLKDQIFNLRGKKIGLFGSGRSEYRYYCGALDVLEEMLQGRNDIIFKFKFEGYPREEDIKTFNILLEEIWWSY